MNNKRELGRAFTSAEQQALLELINGCTEPGRLSPEERKIFPSAALPRLNNEGKQIGRIMIAGTSGDDRDGDSFRKLWEI